MVIHRERGLPTATYTLKVRMFVLWMVICHSCACVIFNIEPQRMNMRIIASRCMLSDNEPTTYLCITYRRADRYLDGRAYGAKGGVLAYTSPAPGNLEIGSASKHPSVYRIADEPRSWNHAQPAAKSFDWWATHCRIVGALKGLFSVERDVCMAAKSREGWVLA